MHALRIICWAVLITAVGWSLIAIGNGRTGELFGSRVFIASGDDMMVALVGQIAALVAIVVLLATADRGKAA